MNLNERKALRAKMNNGERMTFQDAMNFFFHPDDQDAFARSMGWEDMQQMAYYEDQQQEVPPMTDREVDELAQRESTTTIVDGTIEYLAPPPSEILVLMRQDSREVYTDSEDCPPDSFRNLAGVY